MQIRAAQLIAMDKASEERFLDRVTALVTGDEKPEELDPGICVKCRKFIQRARLAGLTTEFEVAAFVACGCTFGTDFDSRPGLPFQRILQEPDVEPRLKAAQMTMLLEECEEDERNPTTNSGQKETFGISK